MHDFQSRLDAIKARISAAASRSGRGADDVVLVAVSKTHPPEAVRAAFECGQTIFGENKVQELMAKVPECPSGARWHLVGHLQSNKIRKVLPLCEMLHGIDSAALAAEVDRIAAELGLFPKVLLEVNMVGEASKFGFQPDRLRGEIDSILRLSRVSVEGLMTVAPYVEDPEEVRHAFRGLRELRDDCARTAGIDLPLLSMGMTGDFEVAIEEGATHVRVGTALFGQRPRPTPNQ